MNALSEMENICGNRGVKQKVFETTTLVKSSAHIGMLCFEYLNLFGLAEVLETNSCTYCIAVNSSANLSELLLQHIIHMIYTYTYPQLLVETKGNLEKHFFSGTNGTTTKTNKEPHIYMYHHINPKNDSIRQFLPHFP